MRHSMFCEVVIGLTSLAFISPSLGAQSALGGGGRYDGLVEQLGGPPTPAVGWAAGIERILLAADVPPAAQARAAFVVRAEGSIRARPSRRRRGRRRGWR